MENFQQLLKARLVMLCVQEMPVEFWGADATKPAAD
jgi:hypothetical protein